MRLKRNEDLRAARQQQINDIRKAQAISLARDEEDFMKVRFYKNISCIVIKQVYVIDGNFQIYIYKKALQ